MINLENNYIENIKFAYIEKIITDNNFKYTLNNKANVLYFNHIFIHDYKLISRFSNILEPLVNKINKKIINAILIFIPSTPKTKLIFKENLAPLADTVTGFYSLNKNNGDIKFINNNAINVDQNQMLTFNTNLKPQIYTSTDNYKCYIELEYDNN
jgi:hypothetical protein